MKRVLKVVALVLVVVFVAIQFVPVTRENPTDGQPFEAPPAVVAIVKRACFDCHSNETVWPWYARVAPASWLVAHDVEEGREHLNLSHFAAYSADKRAAKVDEMLEEIEGGVMPPSQYLLLHSDAKLTPEDIRILKEWERSL